jgi:serine/threonine protein kinase
VWKAIHSKTNTITAIKRVPVENDLDEILNEIKIMKQCRSPYIIRLLSRSGEYSHVSLVTTEVISKIMSCGYALGHHLAELTCKSI